MSPFEPKPRWPNAPLFCIAANRMAFPDRAAMEAYRASIGMSAYSPGRVWRCKVCGMGHYDGAAPDPSGDSSGTGRSKKEASAKPPEPPTPPSPAQAPRTAKPVRLAAALGRLKAAVDLNDADLI